MGKYDQAIECYDKAIALEPRDFAAWHNKGELLFSLKKHDQAIECYDKAIALNPNFAGAWYNKALIFDELKNTIRL